MLFLFAALHIIGLLGLRMRTLAVMSA